MQVPWDWIRQRPHFLAESLSAGHDVTVVHNRPYTRFKLVKNDRPAGLRFKLPFVLPFAYLSGANSFLISRQLRTMIADSELIWLTHPFQYAQIGKAITKKQLVVYDCMDNNLEFCFVKSNTSLYEKLFRAERQLVERSDVVIASSGHLKRELMRLYAPKSEVHVVNNGIDLANMRATPGTEDFSALAPNSCKTISYIGTIAEWFDFDLILESLSRTKNIRYYLYGPARVTIPNHERIKHFGQIDHGRVFEVMRQSDALVMPFVLNELVLAINPVKLYEYICSNKPAIAVRYDETSGFEQFVHLYDSADAYFSCMDRLVAGALVPKRSETDSMLYVENNTWEKRAAQIMDILHNTPMRR